MQLPTNENLNELNNRFVQRPPNVQGVEALMDPKLWQLGHPTTSVFPQTAGNVHHKSNECIINNENLGSQGNLRQQVSIDVNDGMNGGSSDGYLSEDEGEEGCELHNSGSGKRKKNRWTLEETELLKDLVKKFGKGNWKKILEEGVEIFRSRNQVDLKDKWRNLEKYGEVERLPTKRPRNCTAL